MDDLLVGGVNDDEHLRNLEGVFQLFQKYGLRVTLPKCVFMAPSVIYFGLRFSERGIQPTDEKVKAIRDAPTPRNVTELRSILGMLAALSNFISKLSTLAHPPIHFTNYWATNHRSGRQIVIKPLVISMY